MNAAVWDAVVVGAGPAGSIAARQIARHGLSVLLVDRRAFPRDKVCGSCLNGAALDALHRVSLDQLVPGLGAHPLHRLDLRGYGRQATIALPRGYAISRRAFDLALVQEAENEGVTFRSGVTARLGEQQADGWQVLLNAGTRDEATTVNARVVICADGLAGGFLRGQAHGDPIIAPGSRVGLGARVIASAPPAGEIRMTVTRQGYVGLVRLEDDVVDVAAAVDREALTTSTPEAVLRAMLGEEGALMDFELLGPVTGTPALTRRAGMLGASRLFVVGDATGYEEPFTGEGMAWALHSAIRVTPLAVAACAQWSDALLVEWQRIHRQEVRRRQTLCRALRGVLTRPWLSRALLQTAATLPVTARPVVALLNRPMKVTS